MDSRTARASLVKRDSEWLVAGRMTQQFLTELYAHYTDAEEGIEEGDMVDYNSFADFNNYASLNSEGD